MGSSDSPYPRMGHISYCCSIASNREGILDLHLFLLSDPQVGSFTSSNAPSWSWRGDEGYYDRLDHSIPTGRIDEGCSDDDTGRALHAHSFTRS